MPRFTRAASVAVLAANVLALTACAPGDATAQLAKTAVAAPAIAAKGAAAARGSTRTTQPTIPRATASDPVTRRSISAKSCRIPIGGYKATRLIWKRASNSLSRGFNAKVLLPYGTPPVPDPRYPRVQAGTDGSISITWFVDRNRISSGSVTVYYRTSTGKCQSATGVLSGIVAGVAAPTGVSLRSIAGAVLRLSP